MNGEGNQGGGQLHWVTQIHLEMAVEVICGSNLNAWFMSAAWLHLCRYSVFLQCVMACNAISVVVSMANLPVYYS